MKKRKRISSDEKVIEAIREILWMARRYADGRLTFSALSFNDAYDVLRDCFGDQIEYNNKEVDLTLTGDGKFFPYAQDGQYKELDGSFDCVSGRKYFYEKKK